MNSLIPRIPLELFLKIWGIPIIFSALGFGIKLIPKIKQYKKKLRDNIDINRETRIPYLAEKNVRKLLEFDDKKHLVGLGIAILFGSILGIIYAISLSIEPFISQEWYEIFVSICGWIAVLPVLVTIIIIIRLYVHFVQLSSTTSRR